MDQKLVQCQEIIIVINPLDEVLHNEPYVQSIVPWGEKNRSNFFSHRAPSFSVTQLITFNYFALYCGPCNTEWGPLITGIRM